MTTPVLQALHANYPDAKIDIVSDRRSSDIFLHCPYRGEIYYKEKQKIMRGGLSLLKSLLKKKYGLIVDLRTDGLAYLLRAEKRLTKWQRKACGTHAVEQHIGVISSLHDNKKIPACHIWINEGDKLFARETLGNFVNKRLLGLGPGANWNEKIWPKERYLALTERVKDLFDAVIILGDTYDREYSEYISNNSILPCLDLCGRTNLLQTAAIQELLEIFIGNDSGLGHMASAVGTPSLTIFGPGKPERYRPWGEKSLWIEGKDKKTENVSVDDVASLLKRNLIYLSAK